MTTTLARYLSVLLCFSLFACGGGGHNNGDANVKIDACGINVSAPGANVSIDSCLPVYVGLNEPKFGIIPSQWNANVQKLDMKDIWASSGISATGTNYYLLPNPVTGQTSSARFDPSSSYYQSWVGIYTVDSNNEKYYAKTDTGIDADAIVKLGIADQKGWLQGYAGLSSPFVELDTSVPVKVESTIIDGHLGWKVSCRWSSNIDTGALQAQQGLSPLLTVAPATWNALISAYAVAKLDTVAYVYVSPETKKTNVIYYNGIVFDDLKGAHHDTLPEIGKELETIARGITTHL